MKMIKQPTIPPMPKRPTFDARDTQYNIPIGTDYISRAQAIYDIWTVSPLARLDRKWVDRWLRQLPSAQPEIIRCKDCKHWLPGYITDNDDFIPPKCGEWQQMVGHSSDDYCSLAERREDE